MSDKGILIKVSILICSISLLYLSYAHIATGLNEQMGSNTFVGYDTIVGFLMFSLPYFIISYKKKTNLVWPITLLGINIAILFLLTNPSILGSFRVIGLLLWVFCYYLGSRISNCSNSTKSFFLKTMFLLTTALVAYYLYFYYIIGFLEYQKSTDTIFFLIVYMPFLFLYDGKKVLKITATVMFCIICFLSLKRSVVIGLFVFLAFLFILEADKKVFKKWYFWIIIILIIYGGIYVSNTVGEILSGRFNEIIETGGSGREGIYTNVLHHFSFSNLFEFLFGHGFMSVREINGGILAHNDFLQLLYDGGLITILFYLSMWYFLFSVAIKNIRNRKKIGVYYSIYISSVFLLLTLTMLNCFIYSYMLLSPLMLAIGYLVGEIRDERQLLSL